MTSRTGALLTLSLAAAVALTATPAVAAPITPTPAASAPAKNSLRLPFGGEPDILVGAHRGQWRDHPENSIPGIVKAIEDGAEVIEIDIKRTADGQLVLMHDDTVNRTTNGAGRVDQLTLAQIKALRLQGGLGNGAALSAETVPTFAEVLRAVRGRNVLINLDKGWPFRDQLVTELRAAKMAPYALFKGAPNAAEATRFMTEAPEFQYMHIIDDKQVGDFAQFTEQLPEAVEIAYDSPDDAQADPRYWQAIGARTDLWANSMWNSVGGGHTDEASLRDPKLGWQFFADHGFDAIQTDNVRTINAWRDGIDVTRIGLKRQSLRLQAEDHLDTPGSYHDSDPGNECGANAIGNPQSPVDACDLDGAHIVQYVRNGEFFTLEVVAPNPGNYTLTLRHSSDTEPGGTVSVDTGAGPAAPVRLPNQTHNRAFSTTDLGTHKLKRGTQRITLRFTHPDYLSVDWLQLDRGAFVDHGLLD